MPIICQESFNLSTELLEPIQVGKRTRYYLGKKYPGVYFTVQEAKCMFYFFQKFSSKKISVVMKIDFRTVEYYRENIRCKIGAISKKDLIAKIEETQFMHYMCYLEKICHKPLECGKKNNLAKMINNRGDKYISNGLKSAVYNN